MERILLVNCVLVLTIALCFVECILSVPNTYDTQEKKDGESDKKSSYLWFGPRLGRKKRNPVDEYRNTELEKEQLAVLNDILQDSPWAVVAINEGGKRHTVGFTPRLGRESGEDLMSNDRWLQEPELAELMSQRSPPFAPRLGRRFSPYSPRLGRENDKMSK